MPACPAASDLPSNTLRPVHLLQAQFRSMMEYSALAWMSASLQNVFTPLATPTATIRSLPRGWTSAPDAWELPCCLLL